MADLVAVELGSLSSEEALWRQRQRNLRDTGDPGQLHAT
jgi:hypothetical protein